MHCIQCSAQTQVHSRATFFCELWAYQVCSLTKKLELSVAYLSSIKSYQFLKWMADGSILAGKFCCLTIKTNPFVYSYFRVSTFFLTASISFHFKPYCKTGGSFINLQNWKLVPSCACMHGFPCRSQISGWRFQAQHSIKRQEQIFLLSKDAAHLKK